MPFMHQIYDYELPIHIFHQKTFPDFKIFFHVNPSSFTLIKTSGIYSLEIKKADCRADK